ncbi:MAG: SPOR domain-containing protein [Acidobacteriota bacterium]|nr:SPOR domain-containing protein [Acidobacteriota bacterium]
MKIICPKCQYENQADSMRVVCARCATIIEVKQDQGLGLDSNGKRQTARLPFVGNMGNSQPLPPLPNSQSGNSNTPNPDAYATRVGDEFDDVLDIPRLAQPTYQAGNEPTTAFEDVFVMPSYDAPASYNFQSQEKKPTAPIEGISTGQNRQQRSTQDYENAPEPEFMGWPVLPESADDEEELNGGFSSNRGALLARVALGVIVFGLLSFVAYYFLGDKIAKRKGDSDAITENNATGKTVAPITYPTAAVPDTKDSKPPEVKPSAESAKPAPTTAAQQTALPDTNKQAVQPPTGSLVPITPIERKPEGPQGAIVKTPSTPNKGNLTIQIAAFSDQGQANDRVSRLRQSGVEARIVQAEVAGRTWYRVQIGGFKSREEASKHANQLKAQGAVQDFIITTVGK